MCSGWGGSFQWGPTLHAGSDVIRCYKFIYISIYRYIDIYKIFKKSVICSLLTYFSRVNMWWNADPHQYV